MLFLFLSKLWIYFWNVNPWLNNSVVTLLIWLKIVSKKSARVIDEWNIKCYYNIYKSFNFLTSWEISKLELVILITSWYFHFLLTLLLLWFPAYNAAYWPLFSKTNQLPSNKCYVFRSTINDTNLHTCSTNTHSIYKSSKCLWALAWQVKIAFI